MNRPLVAALAVAAALCSFASDETMTSPGVGRLRSQFSPMGGIIIDMVGANGKRLTAQVSPTSLTSGWASASTNFYSVWTQTGFDAYTLQTLLGGGLSCVNFRVTLEDGDSGSPNPVYTAMFGTANFPYRQLDPKQPPGYDFDGGTDLYWAIKLANGTYINTGYMGQTTTYRLDASGNLMQLFTGFPGVYALTDNSFQNASHPSQYMPPFAVTGWFSVPQSQLQALYNNLLLQGSMTVGIWDIDPGDQYYDFTQGTGGNILDIPLIPPHVVSFTATPSTISGSGTVTLAWQTQAGTYVAIDNGVVIDPSAVNGYVQVNVTTQTTYTLTVTGAGGTDSARVTVQVFPPLVAATPTLGAAIVGSSYMASLTASGGTTPYAWKLAAGQLPSGLNLSSTGSISGTPTATGTSTLTLQVTDSSTPTQTATQVVSITVTPGLSISTLSVPNALLSYPYSQVLSATGGTAPYIWNLASGNLPAGLTLSHAGILSGNPASVSAFNFTARVTDSTVPTPQTRTQFYSLVVSSKLAIQTTSLPTGIVGARYSQSLSNAGGASPYTWTVAAGNLPTGLSTSTEGVISGTPTTAGAANFVVQLVDGSTPNQIVSQSLSLTIVPALAIQTAAVSNALLGSPYNQTLGAAGGITPYVWTLDSGKLPSGLALTADGNLTGTPVTTGSYSFTARVTDSNAPNPQSQTQTFNIVVSSHLSIGTTTLPVAVVGTAYAQNLSGAGGTSGYTWTLAGGALPTGLSLSTDGKIAGTPTSPGTASFVVQLVDNSSPSQTATQSLWLTTVTAVNINTASLPNALLGFNYTQNLNANGGTSPYAWSIASGSLPAGLTLTPAGIITGIPIANGTSNFTVRVTDSTTPSAQADTRSYTIVVTSHLSVLTTSLPNATVGATYSQTLAAAGGSMPYTWTVTVGSLPPGLSLSNSGIIGGTPTAPSTATFTVQVVDQSNPAQTTTQPLTLVVANPLTINTPPLPNAILGVPYSQNVTASGGTSPYLWTIASGALPAGLSLAPNGTISGAPTSIGASNFALRVTDSTTPGAQSQTQSYSISVASGLSVLTTSLPLAALGGTYSQTLSAGGGSTPYTWTLASGTLPTGLNLSAAGTLSGTPTSAGTFAFIVQVLDHSGPAQTAAQMFSITVITSLVITTPSLANALLGAPYSQNVSATGGTAPYVWSITAGALPAGLTFSASGAISGTPISSTTSNFTIQVTDSTTPVALTKTQVYSITAGSQLAITTPSLSNGVIGVGYSQSLSSKGGTSPYIWTVVAGTLPAGLSVTEDGTISGTPTAPGTSSFMAQVSDTSTPAQTVTQPLTITIVPGLAITTTTLPNAVLGALYVQQVVSTGGTPPYVWSVTSGTLPGGLTLTSDGNITGSPSVTGSGTITLQVLDSTQPRAQSRTQVFVINVGSQLAIQTTTLPNANVGAAYSQTVVAAGGTKPYTWTVDSGPLPYGLTLSASGAITGTPTAPGLTTFVVRATDHTSPTAQTATQVLSIFITSPLTIDTTALADGTASHAYAQALTVHNGVQPYLWTVASGKLPSGIQVLATGALIGTPALAGDYSFTLQVADSSIPSTLTATESYTLHINAAFSITTTSLPGGSTGVPYAASIAAIDGIEPYSFAVVFGSLPPGLALNPNGTIGGTPTAAGVYNLLVRASDGTAPVPQTSDRALVISIDSNLAISTASLPDGIVGVPYNQALTATNGTQPYTWSVATGVMPPGLTLLQSGAIIGTPNADGTYRFTLQATDATTPTAATSTRAYTIKIALPLVITNDSLLSGIIDSPYTAVLSTTGGVQPYTYSLTTPPPGLTLSAIGVLSGSPTTAGKFTFNITVTDSSATPITVNRSFTVSVNQPLDLTEPNLPAPVTGSLYSQQLVATGGMTPYVWTVASGSLPPGLQLLSPGVLIGNPTRTGKYTVTLKVADNAAPSPQTASTTVTLQVATPLTLAAQTLPPVLPNVAYSTALAATGGLQPYTWSIMRGSLPAGLTLAGNGAITGTSTANGSFPVTVVVTDSAQPPQTTAQEYIVIVSSPFAITTTSPLPPAVVGITYSQPLTFVFAKTPVACSVTSGSLPRGIAVSADGTLKGRPQIVGDSQFVITCQDATGQSAFRALTLTQQEALSIVAGSLSPVIANVPYYRLFQHAGGNGPFTWSASAGTLPVGFGLTPDGLLNGTANESGSFTVTVSVTDSSQPKPQSASLPITLTITPALSAIPQRWTATTGKSFNQSVAATGGTQPLSWTLASGALPPGLSFDGNSGAIAGTPTASGAFNFVLLVKDAAGQTAPAFVSITVSDPLAIPLTGLQGATVGAPYAAMIYATGGVTPYTWAITSGALPPGLTFSVAGGLTGTPSTAGTFAFDVTVTSGGQKLTAHFGITVAPAPPGLSIPPSSAALPSAVVGVLYHAPLSATGAQTPVTWTVASGSLPPGLVLDPSGSLNGTPTTIGTFSFALQITDAGKRSASGNYVLSISSNIAITTVPFAKASVGTGYAQPLLATGGTPPYAWTAPQIPPGLFLSKAGVLSGTPTAPGAFTITLTATDNSPAPLTASRTFVLDVASSLCVTTSMATGGTVGTPYTFTFAVTNGTAPYTWNLVDGLTGPGLSFSPAGILSGTPAKAGTWFFTVKVTDSLGQTATHQEMIMIVDALSISTAPLAPMSIGAPVSTQFAVTGGTAPYTWSVASGALPAGLVLTSSGALTGTPTAPGAADVLIQVADSQQRKASTKFIFSVLAANAPPMYLAPDALTLDPSSQTPIALSLATPYSADLTGYLSVAGTNDLDLAFLQPSKPITRLVRFRFPAGSTGAQFTDGQPMLQAGTVASAITLTATLDNTGTAQSTTAQNRILPLPPTITSAQYVKTASGFDLILNGLSTTREVQSATFRFYGGNNLSSPPFTLDVTGLFASWYQSASSRGSGIFSYRQSFSLTGDLASLSISSVEASLSNSVGSASMTRVTAVK